MPLAKVVISQKSHRCEVCNYTSSRFNDYLKHLKTNKHVSNVTKSVSKKFVFCAKNEKKNIKKCVCGREFKTRGGLWKHKKKCDDVGDDTNVSKCFQKNKNVSNVSKKSHKKISKNLKKKKVVETSAFFSVDQSVELKLKEMEIENIRLQNQILKHQLENDAMKAINKLADKVGDTNCHNTQNININMYLNDKCKNAMNLEDFVDKIKLTLQDLNYAGGNGLTKSINNVFVKSLGDLEPDERPIHCSDKQKKVFYVKENDEWAKDENNIHIDQTIHNIHMGHLDALARWDKDHPNWINDEYLTKEREKYSAVWGPIDEKDKKNEKDLIKECLCETVDLNNDLMSNL
jgi:hypothetical protein